MKNSCFQYIRIIACTSEFVNQSELNTLYSLLNNDIYTKNVFFPIFRHFHIYIITTIPLSVITFYKGEMLMTETNRYLTCGVDSAIPLELQLFLWECVDRLPEPAERKRYR